MTQQLDAALSTQKNATAQANKQTDLAKEKTALAEEQTRQAKVARDRAERLVYASQIARAQSEWYRGSASAAWTSLDATRWDFRGWEYNYLYTLLNSSRQTLRGHTGFVTRVVPQAPFADRLM